jgi:GDP-L-fucose synthase
VEESLGDGKTDENWSYAIAKLAGTELCRAYHKQYGCNFMTVIPCNMYGYNDNFDLEKAHVIPALIRKFHESDTVEVWGHGPNATRVHHRNGGGYYTPHREFLWVDDFAEAVVMLMENHDYDNLYNGVINIGSGHEIQISQLVEHLKQVIGDRKIVWNGEKPQGVKSKLLDSSRLKALGWSPKTPIVNGLKKLNEWYLRGKNENRACN